MGKRQLMELFQQWLASRGRGIGAAGGPLSPNPLNPPRQPDVFLPPKSRQWPGPRGAGGRRYEGMEPDFPRDPTEGPGDPSMFELSGDEQGLLDVGRGADNPYQLGGGRYVETPTFSPGDLPLDNPEDLAALRQWLQSHMLRRR